MGTSVKVVQEFERIFNKKPRVFRSPGRINLIGEHTDYNAGYVLPAGIDKAVYFAITLRNDSKVIIHSADLNDSYECDLSDLSKPEKQWAHFQLSVLEQLAKHQLEITGFETVFGGDIPLGAGMSSSAALECCLLFALNELNNLGLSRMEIVKMAQKAENEYVGVKCGIMDQFASAFGKQGSVVRLDCRSLEYEYFPFHLEGYSLILCDTTVKHSLASSEYNTRREECEEGVAILQKYYPAITSLRDVNVELVDKHREEFTPNVYKRCRFITSEIERVEKACELLKQNQAVAFGELMYETHDGLSKDYEVSCEELDFLVDLTRNDDSVVGARMMGGGFGGCTLNLVKTEALDSFEAKMKKAFSVHYNKELPCYRVVIEDGTNEVIF